MTATPHNPEQWSEQEWAGVVPEIAASVKRAERGAHLLDAAAARERKTKTFPHTWLDDLSASIIDADYIIKSLFGRGQLIVVYGDWGQGKSTVVVDLLAHAAAGMRYRDHRVRVEPGLYMYVAAESARSAKLHFLAWREENLSESREVRIPLAIIERSPDLLNRVDVEALIETLQKICRETGLPLMAVAFDTLARATPGSKEDAEDFGEVVGAADRIIHETGAAVLLVHHSGKDFTKGTRGHSSLSGAADVILSVADGVLTVEKSRDGPAGAKFPFQLVPVEIGLDGDGDPVMTTVIRHVEGDTASRKSARILSGVAKIALQALQEAIGDHGDTLPGSSTIPSGVRGCRLEEWRNQFRIRYGTDGGRDTDAVRKAFIRAREQLAKAETIGVSDPYVWTR